MLLQRCEKLRKSHGLKNEDTLQVWDCTDHLPEHLQSSFIHMSGSSSSPFISPSLMRDVAFQLRKICWVCHNQVFVRNGVIPGEVQVSTWKAMVKDFCQASSGQQLCFEIIFGQIAWQHSILPYVAYVSSQATWKQPLSNTEECIGMKMSKCRMKYILNISYILIEYEPMK